MDIFLAQSNKNQSLNKDLLFILLLTTFSSKSLKKKAKKSEFKLQT